MAWGKQNWCDYARKELEVRYVAPAQFEEMGDLHGMPTVLDPDPGKVGDETTVFSPPDWVPTEDGRDFIVGRHESRR